MTTGAPGRACQHRRGHRRFQRGPASVVVATAAVACLVAGCAGSHPARRSAGTSPRRSPAGSPTVNGAAGLAAYYHQALHWQNCSDGFQCARMAVPADYSRPVGSQFSLPVIRLPATNPAQRIGSLVLNPGGPGGSGISFARQARTVVSAAVRARFDVVGFDPRGVGGSSPAIRCMTGPQLDRYIATDDTPDNAAETSALISASKFFAQACDHAEGTLLAHVSTADAARDMDVLRAALGDARLTYLGKSYGTYLGTYYAQLFPRKVRALVLDGAVDPEESAIDQNIVQAGGFELALRSFAADCLGRLDCPLGRAAVGSSGSPGFSAVDAAVAKVKNLLQQTDHTPLANDLGDGRAANQALVTEGIAAALYSKQYWPLLRTALRNAFAGDGTMLIEFADALWERNSNGQFSNLAEANMAINCVDRPWPHSLSVWRSAAATAIRVAPEFGASLMWGSLPCAYWPVPASAVPAMGAAGAPPILVVGTTRDPATPYRWARALAGDLSSGVLLGWSGDGHTAYGMGSSCVDSIVDRYLIDGTPPRSGTVCA